MQTDDVPHPVQGGANNPNSDPPMVESASELPRSRLRQFWDESSSAHSSPASLLVAMAGLSALLFVTSALLAMSMYVLNELGVPPSPFVFMLFIIQSLLLPPLLCFAFTVSTGMFWYGGILKRFVLVLVAVAPAYTVFCWLLYLLDEAPDSVFKDVLVVIFSCLLAAAAAAMLVQMWTPWSLVHDIDMERPPPTGIRSLVELTVVAAVGLAVMSVWDLEAYMEGLVLIGGVTLLATVAIIGAQIGYLGGARWRSPALILAIVAGFATSLFLNGFAIFEEYGRTVDALGSVAVVWLGMSLYGWLIVIAVTWIQLYWLKFCGWRCLVKHKAAANISGSVDSESDKELQSTMPHPLD